MKLDYLGGAAETHGTQTEAISIGAEVAAPQAALFCSPVKSQLGAVISRGRLSFEEAHGEGGSYERKH